MTTEPKTEPVQLVTTSTDRLSRAIDRILKRFPETDRPTKLTLLNDLAAAIRSGANWGALKEAARSDAATPADGRFAYSADVPPRSSLLADRIPRASADAPALPARLFEVVADQSGIGIADLIDDVQPLFSMRHRDLPIVGLDLGVIEGNGDIEVAPWPNLLVLNGTNVERCEDHALDMEDAVARLAFGALQNVTMVPLYPVLGQLDAGTMRIVLGPCRVAAALPSLLYRRAASRDVPSQGVRVLVDEGATPDAFDFDILLRIIGAAMPRLNLDGFGAIDAPVRFTLSQPRRIAWVPVEFAGPETPPSDMALWRSKRGGWSEGGFYLAGNNIQEPFKLDEALDLALAVLDVDEADLWLHATIGPAPKRRSRGPIRPGWRGSLVRGWRILRLRSGLDAELMTLDPETERRLARGLNGWAEHEGFRLVDMPEKQSVEILVPRDRRRASHHLQEVRAMMDDRENSDQARIGTP